MEISMPKRLSFYRYYHITLVVANWHASNSHNKLDTLKPLNISWWNPVKRCVHMWLNYMNKECTRPRDMKRRHFAITQDIQFIPRYMHLIYAVLFYGWIPNINPYPSCLSNLYWTSHATTQCQRVDQKDQGYMNCRDQHKKEYIQQPTPKYILQNRIVRYVRMQY